MLNKIVKPTLHNRISALRARQLLRSQDKEPTWEGLAYQLFFTLSSAAVVGAGLGYLTLHIF